MQLLSVLVLQAALAPPPAVPLIENIKMAMMDRLQRDAKRQTHGARWTKERVDEDITDPLKPRVEHREQYAVWGDGVRMLQRKVMRDGKPQREAPKPLPFFIDVALLARFEFNLAEPAEVPCDNRECWRLSFAPRLGEVDVSDDPDRKMFASSVGTLLVDKATYAIIRVEGHVAVPYRSFFYNVLYSSVTITQAMHEGTMIVMTIELSYAYDPIIGGIKTKRRFYRTVDVSLPPS
jgi:hypothetical protein